MNTIFIQQVKNSEGSTIIVALLLLVALSLAVFMASDNSLTDSKMMRSSRQYRDNLYRAESIITVAAEEHRDVWLDSDSALFDFSDNNAKVDNIDVELTDEDDNEISVGEYSVSRVEDSPQSGSLAEKFYHLPHKAPTAIGSGYSSEDFEMRRYGVLATGNNSTSASRKVILQTGLSKMFTKS